MDYRSHMARGTWWQILSRLAIWVLSAVLAGGIWRGMTYSNDREILQPLREIRPGELPYDGAAPPARPGHGASAPSAGETDSVPELDSVQVRNTEIARIRRQAADEFIRRYRR